MQAIDKPKNKKKVYFTNALLFLITFGLCFMMFYATLTISHNQRAIEDKKLEMMVTVKDETVKQTKAIERLEKKLSSQISTQQALLKVIPDSKMLVERSRTLRYIDHKVKWGDTVSNISYRYGVSVDEIKRVNQLFDVNLIRCGSSLRIPQYVTK